MKIIIRRKRFQRIFVILALSIFFQNCSTKTEFSDKDFDWLIPYEVGQILIFNSQKNQTKDSILIFEKRIYHPSYNPIASEKIKHTARIRYQKPGSDKTYDLMEMYKDDYDKDARPLISFLGTTFWTQDHEILYQTIGLNSIDKVFSEVVVLAHEKSEAQRDVNIPRVLFWDRSEGIIKYITHSGEEWERVNW